MKPGNRVKAGLLQPLEILTKKWSHVTAEPVSDLLESDGYTAIVVFVDKMAKTVHFSPCRKEVDAMEYARISMDIVFRLHGIPEVMISNHDPRFTCKL